jgi:hypothetical protein
MAAPAEPEHGFRINRKPRTSAAGLFASGKILKKSPPAETEFPEDIFYVGTTKNIFLGKPLESWNRMYHTVFFSGSLSTA